MSADWDPGWNKAFGALFPIPQLGIARLQRRGSMDALTQARTVWLSFAIALLAFWLVLSTMAPWDGHEGWLPVGIVAVGIVAHALIGRVAVRRMIQGAGEQELVAAFNTGMFLGLAIADGVALIAFAASFLTGGVSIYVVGMVLALAGFLRVAPAHRLFVRLDELLAERGSPLRMTEAWRRLLGGRGSSVPE